MSGKSEVSVTIGTRSSQEGACKCCFELPEDQRRSLEQGCPVYKEFEQKIFMAPNTTRLLAREIISSGAGITQSQLHERVPSIDPGVIRRERISRALRFIRCTFGKDVVVNTGKGRGAFYSSDDHLLTEWCRNEGGFVEKPECVLGEDGCESALGCPLFAAISQDMTPKIKSLAKIMLANGEGSSTYSESGGANRRSYMYTLNRILALPLVKRYGGIGKEERPTVTSTTRVAIDKAALQNACSDLRQIRADLMRALAIMPQHGWQRQAACGSDSNPQHWHSDQPEEMERAKRVCRGCPVRLQCLNWALTNKDNSREAVLGGYEFWERRLVSDAQSMW